MNKTMRPAQRSSLARALSAGALVSMLFPSACGPDAADSTHLNQDHAQALAVSAADAGVCVASPPATAVTTDALAADSIVMAPALAAPAGDGGSKLLPDAGGPGCASWCFAVANQGNAKCNSDYAADVQECSDIWYQCMGWPLMRCFAKADCDADYNACVASAAKTRKMCNNLVADQYNSCLANVCGEAQN
jgi:hypothetical protein